MRIETLKQAGKPITRYSDILNKNEMKQVLDDVIANHKPNKKLVIEVRQT